MKNFKVDSFRFAILPIIVLIVMIIYVFLFIKSTSTYINVSNIGLDIILIFMYFRLFIYEINLDSQGIDFKGVLKKKRVLTSELISLKQGGILTLIKTEKGRFFILSSKKDKEVIKGMFKDI